jgi:hypothetical protein
MKGWKELEYEVVRDCADVRIKFCDQFLEARLKHLLLEHDHMLQHGKL